MMKSVEEYEAAARALRPALAPVDPAKLEYPWLKPGEAPTRLDTIEATARLRANDPWKPRPDYDGPALADDAGPVETMLSQAAAHRKFLASVASPSPRRRPGGPGCGA